MTEPFGWQDPDHFDNSKALKGCVALIGGASWVLEAGTFKDVHSKYSTDDTQPWFVASIDVPFGTQLACERAMIEQRHAGLLFARRDDKAKWVCVAEIENKSEQSRFSVVLPETVLGGKLELGYRICATPPRTVTRLSGRKGMAIDQVCFHFSDDTTNEYGGTGGSEIDAFPLHDGERIVCVEHQQQGPCGGNKFLGHGFRFITSEERKYEFCAEGTGDWTKHGVPRNRHIIGLRFETGAGKHPGSFLGIEHEEIDLTPKPEGPDVLHITQAKLLKAGAPQGEFRDWQGKIRPVAAGAFSDVNSTASTDGIRLWFAASASVPQGTRLALNWKDRRSGNRKEARIYARRSGNDEWVRVTEAAAPREQQELDIALPGYVLGGLLELGYQICDSNGPGTIGMGDKSVLLTCAGTSC